MSNSTKSQQDQFARDVLAGLAGSPKSLSSKYFYDDEGSRLFVEIMKLPEYYLTDCELEIFREQGPDILAAMDTGERSFDLFELGAGDGTKTSLLIDHFLKIGGDFRYIPVDISSEALAFLTGKFERDFPGLEVAPEKGDYFDTLESFSQSSRKRKIVLFLGSNIGNFRGERALEFFRRLRSGLNENDHLLIGFDLHKDPKTIIKAYDDPNGVTARFNLNLLVRINRELGADFDTGEFAHYASYHPIEKAARSFLISRKKQTVHIEALSQSIEFDAWEPIFMEISQKYDLATIEMLAAESGFGIVKTFFDSRNFYADSLWKPISGS